MGVIFAHHEATIAGWILLFGTSTAALVLAGISEAAQRVRAWRAR